MSAVRTTEGSAGGGSRASRCSPAGSRWQARAGWVAWLLLGAALGLSSCAGHRKGPGGPEVHENGDMPQLPADRVERIEHVDRPPLQLVRRKGDPSAVVALAVFVRGGSRDALLLSALISQRLGKTSDVEQRVHSLGLVAAREVSGPAAAAAFVSDFARALEEKITVEEMRAIREGAYLEAAAQRSGSPSPFGSCMAELGHEGRSALQEDLLSTDLEKRMRRLDKLRASIGAAQIGIGVVGEEPVLDAVAAAHDRPWPEGKPLDDLWEAEQRVAVVESAGGRQLRIALRLPDSEAALASARGFRRKNHPFHARLQSLSSAVSLLSTRVTLRPAGACLGMTLSWDGAAEPPTPDLLAAASTLVLDELEAAAAQAGAEDERAFALLSPRDALEAASLSAWTAVRSKRTSTRRKTIVEYAAPTPEVFPDNRLKRSLETTRERWKERKLPLRSRDEEGQAELWVLLASTCGTHPEDKSSAGLRALTVRSLASQFDGRGGVSLLPWIGSRGIGLVAHAPAYRGESGNTQARRVGRALGAALTGGALDGRAVAEARSLQLESIGSDPGAELLTQVLGGDHPSLLRPWGTQSAVAAHSAADVERTRGDLAREPLRLAVLANAGPDQAEVVQDALSEWLAPGRTPAPVCSGSEVEPEPPQRWILESIEDGVESGGWVGVSTQGPAELGHALAFHLNRGPLTHALSHSDFAASARAYYYGDGAVGALVVQVGAEEAHLDGALQQVRATLDRIARRSLTSEDLEALAQELARRRARSEKTPAGRLVETWLEPPEVPIEARSMRIFARQISADRHRVVEVKRRR